MISASWSMPKSYVPPVQEESEKVLVIKDLIKNKMKFSGQQKGKKLQELSKSEQLILQDFLNEAMKELGSKILVKAIAENLIHQPQTHDLDDVYDPQGKIPFPNESPQY